jgi:hypothetical protein
VYKIGFYVPVNEAERVKLAMFSVGAGKIGNYECCSFEFKGTGQFKAINGANPFIGEINRLEKVEELRIEMVCEKKYIKEVVTKMKEAHPYETVAYDVVEILEF